MSGVKAADVHGRVGFGVAEALGLGQHLSEIAPGSLHLGQDIVAGAVEDAGHGDDLIADHGLTQHLHRRRPAHNRGFEEQRRAGGFGQLRQLAAVFGDQGLVRGDHRLSGAKRRLHGRLGRPVRAADQFDEDVVVARGGQGDGIIEPRQARDIRRARARPRAGADAGDRDGAPGGRESRPLRQQFEQADAHRSQARHADPPLIFRLGHRRRGLAGSPRQRQPRSVRAHAATVRSQGGHPRVTRRPPPAAS